MFDLEQFTADCRAALAADSSHSLVCEVVARAVSDPNAVLKGNGEPKRAEVQKLYHSPDLHASPRRLSPTIQTNLSD